MVIPATSYAMSVILTFLTRLRHSQHAGRPCPYPLRVAEHDLLVLGLDGFDIGFAEPLIESGDLPALRELRDRSRHFLLDHGPATRTGLAWEHFATGWTPERARRASMVDFESTAY